MKTKWKSLILAILVLFLVEAKAASLAESYQDFRKVTDIRQLDGDYLLVLEGELSWKVEPGQEGLISGIMDDHELQKQTFGEDAINHISLGDRVIAEKVKNGVVVFKDLETSCLLGCTLHGFPEGSFPKISKSDVYGYFIELSDGTEWMVSWGGSFISCNWEIGDVVIPMRQSKDCYSKNFTCYNFNLLNLGDLIGRKESGDVLATPMVWK